MTDDKVFNYKLKNIEQKLDGVSAQMSVLIASDRKRENDMTKMNSEIAANRKEIDKTSATNTWLVRLVLGAIILGAIGFMLNGGFNL
jgi:hypothetical protein